MIAFVYETDAIKSLLVSTPWIIAGARGSSYLPRLLKGFSIWEDIFMIVPDDIIGKRYNRWTVLSRASNSPKSHASRLLCKCDCGTERILYWQNLRKSKSCGCYRNHHRSRTPLHNIWIVMTDRCRNPNNKDFKYYGGRGISVCERWHKFDNFLADMGCAPTPNHSIDRRDNNGNYDPANCQWSTDIEQANNTRRNHFIEFNGQRKTIAQWSRSIGIGKSLLWARIVKLNWPIEKAFKTPAKKIITSLMLAFILASCGQDHKPFVDISMTAIVWQGYANENSTLAQKHDSVMQCLSDFEIYHNDYPYVKLVSNPFICGEDVHSHGCYSNGIIYALDVPAETTCFGCDYDIYRHEEIHWATGQGNEYHESPYFIKCQGQSFFTPH